MLFQLDDKGFFAAAFDFKIVQRHSWSSAWDDGESSRLINQQEEKGKLYGHASHLNAKEKLFIVNATIYRQRSHIVLVKRDSINLVFVTLKFSD